MNRQINFLRVNYLAGPNMWTYRPVIEAWVDIGSFEACPSNTLDGFTQRLIQCLPGLAEHRCGVGVRGGFLQRLQEGTWLGHVLEHIALELQTLSGMPTGFGQTRSTNVSGVYKLVFRTYHEQVGRLALSMARDLLMALVNNDTFDLNACLDQLITLIDTVCLGPSTQHIVEACTARNIPWIRLSEGNLVQFGHGRQQRRIWTALTDKTSAIAVDIASDKHLTKTLLNNVGVPVPQGLVVYNAEEAWLAAEKIGLPVVVKPVDCNHGNGVVLNLMTRESVLSAYEQAILQTNQGVIVEQFFVGNDYRLLLVDKKVIAVSAGEVAGVVGDGVSNIIELVNLQINTDPRRGDRETHPIEPLYPEKKLVIIQELKRQGLTPYSVPYLAQEVSIQRNGNLKSDVTEQLHPSIKAMAELAARILDIDIAGIDLIATDISQSIDSQKIAIIEVNASPGLLPHIKPGQGQPRPVGQAIVQYLFPLNETGRIPVVGIIGSQGTTLVAKLIAWLLKTSKTYVGLACQDGLFVGARQISNKNAVNWSSGQQLLTNPLLEAAVIENDAHMILSQGLAYDRCDVGIVTDLTYDPALAECYINDSDALYKVLRTQVDVVLPNGFAVLNADDIHVLKMAEHCDGAVILFATSPNSDAILSHRDKGHQCVFLRNQQIIIAHGLDEKVLLALESLNINISDQAEVLVAALAAACALNIETGAMIQGLMTFDLAQ